MASPMSKIGITMKRHKGLSDQDSRFVEEVCKVVSSLDGASSMKLKIVSRFPTKFSLTVLNPPVMTLDEVNQISMMNDRILSISVDLNDAALTIEASKYREDIKRKRKRVAYDEYDIPDDYDFSMVDKMDDKHVRGILRNLLGMTSMEFSSTIKPDAESYTLDIEDVETLNVMYIIEVVEKYRAFVTSTVFNFAKKKMVMKVRRNDTPIQQIRVRKKLKLIR